ncbi:MAG: N-acetyltransferase [Leucobacter sp.]|nr:N-acetyltransferase [Leucobacter sp.]
MTEERFEVRHVPGERRFVLIDREAAGGEAEIGEEQYHDVAAGEAAERIFFHTVVSEEYAGQGLASKLVRAALDGTIADGFAIVPVCPYVAAWLRKHEDYADRAVAVTSAHLQALDARQ